MEKEIKCPNCGTVFKIDESNYNSILQHVKNEEFDKELKEKLDSMLELNRIRLESNFKDKLNEKENLINRLNEEKNKLAIESKSKYEKIINDNSIEINNLKKELQFSIENKNNEIREALLNEQNSARKKDIEILELKNKLELKDHESELKVIEAVKNKDQALLELKSNYEASLKAKQEEVDFYKDFKAKTSIKLVGESLEQHCYSEFNKLRPLFPKAYFEKDNVLSETNSKGDFIYRDFDDEGNEFISIMFEMKNETDITSTKKTNESFLKELDKDRNEKKCEFAVLVSLLEIDNELYNTGIVDMSHIYPKMYVVRPQFFIPIITLLRSANLKSSDYKKELALIKSQNIDISHFEENIEAFKEGFGKNYLLASKKFEDAIKEIDKTIKSLEKTKQDLISSNRNLGLANKKAQELTIKKLVKNAPSIAKKFDDLKK